jgi:hypothetical protein
MLLKGASLSRRLTMKGVFAMGNSNKSSLPQTPKNLKYDGNDVEYSKEFADQADLEAQARSNAANQRVKTKR